MQPEWILYRQSVTPTLKKILSSCDSQAYLQGRTYLYKGHVETVWLDKNIFYATVKGKNQNRYQCSFNTRNEQYHCTCPSYRNICKHIVAMTFYLIDIKDWRSLYLQSVSSNQESLQTNAESYEMNQTPVVCIDADDYNVYQIKIEKNTHEPIAINSLYEITFLSLPYRSFFENAFPSRTSGTVNPELIRFLKKHPEIPVELSDSRSVQIEDTGEVTFQILPLNQDNSAVEGISINDINFLKANRYVLQPALHFQNYKKTINTDLTSSRNLLLMISSEAGNGLIDFKGKDIVLVYLNLNTIEFLLRYYANHILSINELYEFKSRLHKNDPFHKDLPFLPEPFQYGPLPVIHLSAFEGEKSILIKGKINFAYCDKKNGLKLLTGEKKSGTKPDPNNNIKYATFPINRNIRNASTMLYSDENGVVAKRKPRKEDQLLQTIPLLKFKKSSGEFELGPRKIIKFVEEIYPELEKAGIPVRIPENLTGIFSQTNKASFRVENSSEIDWFGKIEFEGISEADRKMLIEANAKNEEFSKLSDGRWIHVDSTGLRKIFHSLNNSGFEVNAEGEVEHLNKGDLIALSRDLDTKGDERYTQMMEQFKNIRDIAPENLMDVGKNYMVSLRDYQKEGVSFLRRLYEWKIGGILADDMGLGKTIQALAFINWLMQKNKSASILIVGPVAALSVWSKEAARFFPEIQVSLWHGASRKNSELANRGVILTSYGVLIRDIEILKEKKFDVILADEAQVVKNVFATTTRTLASLTSEVFYCLTGTPLENHIGECWSLMNLSFPGLLGRRKQFMQRFSRKNDEEINIAWFKNRTSAFLLRRTKGDVLKELPPRNEILVQVPMHEAQKKAHDNTRIAALAAMQAVKDKKLFVLLRFLMKMRRIACHPDLGNHAHTHWGLSGKLEYLREVIGELNETASGILIFSQYTDLLKLVSRMFDSMKIEYFYLDGSTTAKNREKLTEAFQNGERKIFLISLKAGGTALTLTRADTVIHLDPWWNPAAENQASDRAHRIGQSRPVFIYKLVSSGSIEEKVIALQEKKKKLFSTIFDGGAFNSSNIAVDELIGLLEND